MKGKILILDSVGMTDLFQSLSHSARPAGPFETLHITPCNRLISGETRPPCRQTPGAHRRTPQQAGRSDRNAHAHHTPRGNLPARDWMMTSKRLAS